MTQEVSFDYLTVKDVCRITGFGRTMIGREYREGRLKAFKLGGRVLFKPSDVNKWLLDAESRVPNFESHS